MSLAFRYGALILCACCTAAYAQNPASSEDEVVELAPLLVTGEVYAFGAQKLVYVNEEKLEQLQALDLADVFSLDPSIKVGGGIAAAQKIYIRGIEDKLLNITIDGATQGGYLSHHHGQYVIEPELLKYVEVEPGPGGATQGPGALAGSIRFVTKGPFDFLRNGQQFGSFHKATYISNSEGIKWTSAGYGEIAEGHGILLAVTYLDVGDYEAGEGVPVDYTGHQQLRTFLKTESRINGQQFALSYERVEDEGIYRHRPNFFGWFNHPVAPNDPVKMNLVRNTFVLSYSQSPEDLQRGIEASSFYTDYTIDRLGQYEMGYESFGVNISERVLLGDHAIVFGGDIRQDTLSFTGKGSVTGFARTLVYQTIPDEDLLIVGAYAEDQWSVSDRLEVSLGARAELYEYDDKDGRQFTDAGISPSAGVSYEVVDGLRANVSYGYAFRGLTIIDAITANEGSVTNADSIDPERARNLEVGFQYHWKFLTLNATAYRQKIEDVIGTFQGVRDNLGDLEVRGYDVSAGAKWNHFDFGIAVSHSNPELNGMDLTDDDFGLGTAYGRSWAADIGYTFEALDLRLGWSGIYVEEFNPGTGALYVKPSYVVHNLSLHWDPVDRLRVTMAIHNLFDKFYVDQATSGYNSTLQQIAGLPEPGRDIRLSVSYQF